jgi:Tfp pilus assembly protein PilF
MDRRSTSLHLGGAALVVLAVLAVYWPAIHGGFLFDDDTLVTRSAVAQAADGLRRIWFSTEAVDYWPVTNTTFWVEWRLWGSDPTGYHVSNLLLHAAGAMVFWAVLRQLRVPCAFFASLLFALHPLNVSSVAWISQRKNALAMVFFLLAIWFWQTLDLKVQGSVRLRYALSVLAFLVAMLSKGSVAILPGVLLLIIWWQNGAVTRRDLIRVTPFIVIAVALTLVNIGFQARATAVIRDATLVERVLAAGGVIWFYLWKALVPVRLMFMYPPADFVRYGAPLAAAAAATFVLWKYRARAWGRGTLVAWLFFVIALVPVLGFTDVYFMRYSPVADHYAYIAVLSVTALAGAALSRLPKPAAITTGAVILIACGSLTRMHARTFSGPETLYRATLAFNPSAWALHNNLGALLVDERRDVEAAAALREALRLRPNLLAAQRNLCLASSHLGQFDEAIAECSRALTADPGYVDAHFHLGRLFAMTGRAEDAERHYRELLRLRPGSATAHTAYGLLLAGTGRTAEAAAAFRAALAINPADAEAQRNLTNLSGDRTPLR